MSLRAVSACAVAISSAEDAVGASGGATKASVRTPLAPVMTRFVKVAIPAIASMVVVPVSVPPPVAIDAVIAAAAEVTTFPAASRTSTTGCVASGAPDAAPPGCILIASVAGVPGMTVMATAGALMEPAVAMSVVCPTRAAVTTPVADTRATVGSAVAHETDCPTRITPLLFRVVATKVAELPEASVMLADPVTAMDAAVTSGGMVGRDSPPHEASVSSRTIPASGRTGDAADPLFMPTPGTR